MNDSVNEIVARIRQMEDKLEAEFEKNRARYEVRLRGRMAWFAEEVIARQRAFKIKWPQFLRAARLLNVLVAPVIYSLIVPLALIDVWTTLYQHLCFRVYGVPLVKRSSYVFWDRNHLAYLNGIEKMNCAYCGYGTGVLSYAREVAGRTEQFWCPIKHALRVRDPHQHYAKFLDFGDAEGYRAKLAAMRQDVRDCEKE
ncbi:MAG: hypothetical protein WC612_01620 [Bdellovibrionales bacterium]|jgi:hypothetical protein